MEFAVSGYCNTFFDRVSRRVRTLSLRLKIEKWLYLKKLVAPALLIAAAILASLAYQLSSEDGLEGWLKLHAPSGEVWDAMAGARKFYRVTDPKLLQKLYRSIPSSAESNGMVWRTPEGSKIAVFLAAREGNTEGDLPFRIYAADFEQQNAKWEPLGMGWPGLEASAKSMETYRLEQAKKTKKAIKKAEFIDPDEIRY